MLSILGRVSELSRDKRLCVVLGSKSPRRIELLRDNVLGGKVDVVVAPSNFKEDYDKSLYVDRAKEYVREYAVEKARDVEKAILSGDKMHLVGKAEYIVLVTADTVVTLDGRILEKPNSHEEAVSMLLGYSERSPEVITGACLIVLKRSDQGEVIHRGETVFDEKTTVCFSKLDEHFVKAYVATDEPMDKAGGYGIQGLGSQLISSINGCYFNVVGLPVFQVASHMLKAVRKVI